MIEIDGGKAGGQVLRTAIGLSAITGKAIRVKNIRGIRYDGGGLKPQHLLGIQIAKQFCNAETRGLTLGSKEIEFIPRSLRVLDTSMDIGTAGSITLLLQTLLPILIFSKRACRIEIIGGTDVKWSIPIDYFRYVTLRNLQKFGINLEAEVEKRGFYPKGRGKVFIKSKPVDKLKPIFCLEREKIKSINIISVAGNLPKSVAERQGRSALHTIQYYYPDVKVYLTYRNEKTACPGTVIVCYATCENSVLGGSALGEPGINAEKVGERAAEELVKSLHSNTCFDKYTADQVLPFMALAEGESSITVEKITDHCLANIDVIEKILPVKFDIREKKNESGEISVRGLVLDEDEH